MACWTVVIFSASSSGISVSNSSSSAITSSTVSSESAPRSSTNDDSLLISPSATPSCSATIFLTRCSMLSMRFLPRGYRFGQKTEGFYQKPGGPRLPRPGPSDHVHPAVDVQRGTGDVPRRGRGEERHGRRDIVRGPEATQWNPGQKCLPLCIAEGFGHVRVDETRCHAVDRDVTAADL